MASLTEPKITKRKLTDYTPDPRNANRGTQRGQYMVDTSIEQVGAGRSLVATADGVIAAGNKTLQALVDAGIVDVVEVETDGKTAVVVRRTDWSGIEDEQARKYAYFDNRASEVGLEWDAATLMADLNAGVDLSAMFHEDELDALLDELGGWNRTEPGDDPGAQMDRAEELREKWQTERGQVWDVSSVTVPGRSHRVMCGDSTSAEDVARLMDGERAQAVVTDPPYGVDYDGGTTKRDKLIGDGTPALYAPFLDTVRKFCRDDMALYLFYADGDAAVTQAVTQAGFIVRNTLIWNKNLAQYGALSAQYKQKHEPFLYCFLRGKAPKWTGPTTEVTVWDINRASVNKDHPTQKPPELFARALANNTERGDLCVDGFLGSGTLLVAAEQTGRICYGMELEPKYVAVVLERLAGMGLEPRLIEDD